MLPRPQKASATEPGIDGEPSTGGARAWPLPVVRARTAAAMRVVLPPLALGVLWLLGATLVLDRFPLPGGDSFGFRSLARNLFIVVLVAHLIGTTALRLAHADLAPPLLAYLAAAILSVAINGEVWGDVRLLATVVGFYAATRALAQQHGSAMLLHWLGFYVVAQLVREFWHQPELLSLREDLRNTLIGDHPNSVGYTLAVLLPLFLGVALRRDGGLLPRLYAVAAPIGLLITFSRAAWGSAVFGVIAIITTLRRFKQSRLQRVSVVSAIALSAIVALSIYSISGSRTEADWQRLRIIDASLSLFRDHWLVGVGFGGPNFKDVFPARYLELYGEGLFLFHAHNSLVDVLVSTGVIGALAVSWLVWRLCRLALRGLRVAPPAVSSEGVSMVVALAIFLLMGLVDVPVSHPKLLFVFAAALAYVETRVGEIERDRAALAAPPRSASG